MLSELLERAEAAVLLAKRAGASACFATASRSRSVELSVRSGKVEKVQESTSRGLSLRLWVGQRYGTTATTDLRPASLEALVSQAVALTRALEPDPHRTITDPALYEGRSTRDLDLVDPAVLAIDRERRLAWAHEMDQHLAGAPGALSATSTTTDGHSLRAVVASNGFSGTRESTFCWLGSSITLDDGERRPEASMWGGGTRVADCPAPAKVARIALERARARLGAQKGPTKRTTLIVDPAAAGRLIGKLLGPAHASALQQGRSFYRGRFGEGAERSFSEKLTIVDDPLIPRMPGSRLFDSEGIAARSLPLIERGVVKNVYVDTYYGKKLGLPPTTGGSSNRIVAPGARSLDAILASASDALYVEGWLGGNSDSTTGDFSLGVRGRLVGSGELRAPVAEMNATGNLITLFDHLVEVGDDPWPYGSLRVPTLVFEGVEISGA